MTNSKQDLGFAPEAQILPAESAVKSGSDQSDLPPIIDSSAILGGKVEVVIRHQNELYRLRATRSGRLLLNK